MIDDTVFRTSEVVARNLDELSREESIVTEKRLLELNDIATDAAALSRDLFEGGFGVYEIISIISSGLRFGAYPVFEGAMAENASAILNKLSLVRGADKAFFTLAYLDRLNDVGIVFSEGDFLTGGECEEVITYVKNQFSDEAFDIFSEELSDPRVSYSTSFKECVRRLLSGEVGYCLLPLEEKGGVRLPTVTELIFRNELKINAVTPVFSFGLDAEVDLKYALISKGFGSLLKKEDDDRYLEFLVSDRSGSVLSDILTAASCFGLTVYRLNTVSIDNSGEKETYYSVALREENKSFLPILCYLTFFVSDFLPIGLYKNLE